MLKTNNKKVTERVYNDFMEMLYDMTAPSICTGSHLVEFREMIEAQTYGYKMSYQEGFAYFQNCGGFGDLYTEEQRRYLAEVLEETPEEANRFDNVKVQKTYANLFYNAYLKACKNYDIFPYWETV